ncbi:hypothetical protein K380107A5_19580 [Holdemania massiliensis]|uniref:hypothetical protein n=1 Tax=Holdemania massiliensis TaxID=1468449 RepID=UPI0036F20933
MTKGESIELKSRITDFSSFKQVVGRVVKRIVVALVDFYHQQGETDQVFFRQVHMGENNKLFGKYIIHKNIKHGLQIMLEDIKTDVYLQSDFKIPLKILPVVSLGKEAMG